VQYCDVELQTAAEQSDGEYVSKYGERKCAENYNKWHNKTFLSNCNRQFGNFKR